MQATETVLAAALLPLHHLTSFSLKRRLQYNATGYHFNFGPIAAALSNFQHLQLLSLGQHIVLPQSSLERLPVSVHTLQMVGGPWYKNKYTKEAAPYLDRLTNLQQLQLHFVSINPDILLSCPQFTRLDLVDVEFELKIVQAPGSESAESTESLDDPVLELLACCKAA